MSTNLQSLTPRVGKRLDGSRRRHVIVTVAVARSGRVSTCPNHHVHPFPFYSQPAPLALHQLRIDRIWRHAAEFNEGYHAPLR